MRLSHVRLCLALSVWSLGTASPSLAQPNSTGLKESTPVEEIESELEITVIGTKTRRLLQDSPSTITVVDDQTVNNRFIKNINDVIRYEPGISVNNRPTRSGNSGYNIRGIDGNRVLILVDGIRVPDIYSNTSRNLVDFDTLKRLEIVRGPASTLYGSDAIGGVVSYTTKNPQDYLQGRSQVLETKLSYSGVDGGFSPSVTVASQSGNLAGSVTYTRRDSSEVDNNSSLAANPQSIDGNNVLAKLEYKLNPQNTVLLSGELFDRKTNTNVRSNIGLAGAGITRTSQIADDVNSRNRVSLGYNFDNPDSGFAQKFKTNFYYQAAAGQERIEEFRTVTTPTLSQRRRLQVQSFNQSILGGDLQLESNFRTGDLKHRISYGVDLSSTNTSRPRDNTEFNLTANTSTKNVGGELYPNKTFPDVSTNRLGLYIQDEIEVGQLSLIPGVRLDYYNLDPRPNDPDFIRIGGNVADVKPISASAISPRLGVVYKVTPGLSLTAQYSRGFRSPPYDDAAIAFTNFAFGYTVIPNANLRPETSDGIEVGLRTNSPRFNSSLVGFYNKYDSFIDTVPLANVTIQGRSFQQFQAQNLGGVEISGVEAKMEYRFSDTPSDGLSLTASAAFAQGNNLTTKQPLDSVNPFTAVVGLRYRAPESKWGTELLANLVTTKTNISTAVANQFVPAGYTSLDLISYYNISPDVKLNLGLFNLLNSDYTRWSDIRGVAATSPLLGLYSQPGFNLAASIGIKF